MSGWTNEYVSWSWFFFSLFQLQEGTTKPAIVEKEDDIGTIDSSPREQMNKDNMTFVVGGHKNSRNGKLVNKWKFFFA